MSITRKEFTEIATKQEQKKSPFIEQRDLLGIDPSLASRPVLYLSAHRGAFNGAFKQHAQMFMDKSNKNHGEKEQRVLDLSTTDNETLLKAIHYFGDHISKPNTAPTLITAHKAGEDEQAPLPGYIVNMIYLPPLDANGKSTGGPATTWALGQDNLNYIMPMFAEFLIEKGYLKASQPKIAQNASKTAPFTP